MAQPKDPFSIYTSTRYPRETVVALARGVRDRVSHAQLAQGLGIPSRAAVSQMIGYISRKAAAAGLSWPEDWISDTIPIAADAAPNAARGPRQKGAPTATYRESGDEAEKTCYTRERVRTLEDLIRVMEIDVATWQVAEWVANVWEMGYRTEDGADTQSLYQVKARMTRARTTETLFPAPVVLKISRPRSTQSTRADFVSIHKGCTHFPYHDPAALNIFYQVLEAVRPQLVVDHGDLLDCEQISDYEKDPGRRVSLQEELHMGAEHLGIVTALAPLSDPARGGGAGRQLYLGNHEDRLRRQIWGESQKSRVMGEILSLASVREALDWGNLLGIRQHGWEVIGHPEHRVLHDQLVLKHGTAVRGKSAQTAKAEYDKYGLSGLSAHTHRQGVYHHRNLHGTHTWMELGMLGSVRSDYTVFPDWEQGFVVVTWSADRRSFGFETVSIRNGKAWFRGRTLAGDSLEFGEVARAA